MSEPTKIRRGIVKKLLNDAYWISLSVTGLSALGFLYIWVAAQASGTSDSGITVFAGLFVGSAILTVLLYPLPCDRPKKGSHAVRYTMIMLPSIQAHIPVLGWKWVRVSDNGVESFRVFMTRGSLDVQSFEVPSEAVARQVVGAYNAALISNAIVGGVDLGFLSGTPESNLRRVLDLQETRMLWLRYSVGLPVSEELGSEEL